MLIIISSITLEVADKEKYNLNIKIFLKFFSFIYDFVAQW